MDVFCCWPCCSTGPAVPPPGTLAAAIVVPVVVVAAGVGLATWWLISRRRNRRNWGQSGPKPQGPVLAGVIVDGQGPRDQGFPGGGQQYIQVFGRARMEVFSQWCDAPVSVKGMWSCLLRLTGLRLGNFP
jgi:hypothetical protein